MSRPPITPADHASGPTEALTLVHYGDFECPLSRDVFGIVRDVQDAFPDRVRYVFRHFPLRLHENALAAAVAADEAGRQGAFWEYHDRLFRHQLNLAPGALLRHAEALGLDASAFDLSGAKRSASVLAQKRGGVRAGVRSTLNLFVGDTLYQEDALDEAITEHVIRPLRAHAKTPGL